MSTTLVVLCLSVLGSIASPGLMRNLSPPRETSSTTLRLTAQRNDTGSWTTKFGDYQMTIEHKHFDAEEVNDKQGGTWTLKVKHTTTTFEDVQDDQDALRFQQNSSVLDTKEDEDGVVMIYEEKPEEDSYADLNDAIKVYEEEKEEEEENEREVLQPMALRFEGNPPEDAVENMEDTATEKEETSDPGLKTVLDILERYRNSHRIKSAETSVVSEDIPVSEMVPTTSTSTTEVPATVEQQVSERGVEPSFGEMTSEEKEHYHMKEERKQIMERFPRSRALDLVSLGYTLYPEVGWLKFNTAHWQWDVARKACQAEGAHLAIPDTLPKIRAFTRILKENTDVIGRAVLKNQVFVGVYDPNNNRRFTTVKGEPFIAESVSIWFPNEPNDADPGEDCVTLHLEGKLRDVPCFFNLPFICQIDLSDAAIVTS